MPEGDAIHRAAMHLQVLAGQRVEVETPHPRAAMKGLAERLDGRLLESVEAVGKNVLLRFEGGLVLRSHLRMSGRWRVERRGASRSGRPWLILRGDEHDLGDRHEAEAGPVLLTLGQRPSDAPARDAREADRKDDPQHDDGELDRHPGLPASRSAMIAIRETSRTRRRVRPAWPAHAVGRATIAFVAAGR